MPETTPLSILPDTRLSELFAAYPALEKLVIERIPSYGQLQTPVLRQAVAKSLTLEQAAASAQIPAPELVMSLRKAAGLPEIAPSSSGGMSGAPEWVRSGKIVNTIDARPLLAQGIHPKAMVTDAFSALKPGEVVLLITPFVPGPLIEMGRAQGCQTWTRQGEPGKFETYFGAPE